MTPTWVVQEAADFWSAVGGEVAYPHDLEWIVCRGFPVSVVALPNLRILSVERWLQHQQIPYRFLCQDRSLCGCIIAIRGQGLIFVDSCDGAADRRYTLAHEIAHFLHDYLAPRRTLLALFGESIRPVLDGERPATQRELLDALLCSVRLETYIDLMPRAADGGIDEGYILRAEEQADRFALELLAPAERVIAHVSNQMDVPTVERVQVAIELLTTDYDLPLIAAKKYAISLFPPPAQGSTARWLGL